MLARPAVRRRWRVLASASLLLALAVPATASAADPLPTPTPTATPTVTPTPTPTSTPEPEPTPTLSAPDPRPADDPSRPQEEESRGEVLGTMESQATPTARLTGLAGCVKTTKTAKVTGTRIRSVVFRLDGKTLRGVKPSNHRLAATKVTVGYLETGTHTLTARITFSDGTKPETLKLHFSRCGKAH